MKIAVALSLFLLSASSAGCSALTKQKAAPTTPTASAPVAAAIPWNQLIHRGSKTLFDLEKAQEALTALKQGGDSEPASFNVLRIMTALQGSHDHYLDAAKKEEAEKLWAQIPELVEQPLDELHDKGARSIISSAEHLKRKLAPFESGSVYEWSPLKKNLLTHYISLQEVKAPGRDILDVVTKKLEQRAVSPIHAEMAIDFSEELVARVRPSVVSYYEKVAVLQQTLLDDKKRETLQIQISRLSKDIERSRVKSNCTDSSKACKLVKKRTALIKSRLDREKVLFETIMIP